MGFRTEHNISPLGVFLTFEGGSKTIATPILEIGGSGISWFAELDDVDGEGIRFEELFSLSKYKGPEFDIR